MEGIRLQTENLAVGYNGKALIRDICLSLRPGEIMTLIGPNGAGKSTILKTIIRQLALIRGTVYLDGRDMARLRKQLPHQLLRPPPPLQQGRGPVFSPAASGHGISPSQAGS